MGNNMENKMDTDFVVGGYRTQKFGSIGSMLGTLYAFEASLVLGFPHCHLKP